MENNSRNKATDGSHLKYVLCSDKVVSLD